ncbi:MAG: BatA domain-containing protein [Muribaculaceae bacterium]|nr:BatA domain-containing protein [Muribaculaceae bacterium]
MHFAHPKFLWTLLVLVPLIVWYIIKQRNMHATISLSTTAPFAALPRSCWL